MQSPSPYLEPVQESDDFCAKVCRFFRRTDRLRIALIGLRFYEIVRALMRSGSLCLTSRHGKASILLTDVVFSWLSVRFV